MLFLNLINHVLQQNPEVRQELSGYNGIVIGLSSGSLKMVGRINAVGLLEFTHKSPNTALVANRDVLPEILQGKMPSFSDFAIEGDMELGMNIFLRCAAIRYFPLQDFREILGDETLERWLGAANKWGRVLQGVGQFLMFQAANQPTAREQELLAQLSSMKKELERANKRISRLEKRLREHHDAA